MKQRFFMLVATILLMSTSVFAQNSENWDGDVNKDGVVDVADINAIIYLIKKAAGEYDGKTYYWYLGYDQDLYDNTASSKSKMLTLSSNYAPTNYTRSSGKKFTIPGTVPNYLIMVIPSTWDEPVIGNPAGGTLGLSKEKSNITITGINGITFDVYSSAGQATIREVYIN